MQEAPGTIVTPDFHSLAQRFQRPLLAYAARITGDHGRAQDCVQETFIELQKRIRDQPQRVNAKWLFSVRMSSLQSQAQFIPPSNIWRKRKQRVFSCKSSRPC